MTKNISKAILLLVTITVLFSLIMDTISASDCPGDLNGDRNVDHWDLKIVLRYFGQNMPTESYYSPDANNDGKINLLDLIIVSSHYATICSKPGGKTTQPQDEASFQIIAREFGTKDYGSPYITITVMNTSIKTGYNVACRVYAKDKDGVIVDDGFAYFAGGGDILPGEKAKDEAIFFNLESLEGVTLRYDLTWLTR